MSIFDQAHPFRVPATASGRAGSEGESRSSGAERHRVQSAPGGAVSGHRWVSVLAAIAGLALFLAALEVLRIELRTVSWPELTRDIGAVPRAQLVLAVLLTIVNYGVLTGYDQVAFVYIGKVLPRRTIALVSFLAYAISNNVGFAMLSGASVRYRFYTRLGVTPLELSRIVFSYSVTFWLGLFALGGLSLLVAPIPESSQLPSRQFAALAGSVLIVIPVAYLVAAAIRRSPVQFWRVRFVLPSLGVALAQFVLSVTDWALAGAVLYVLLPPTSLSFPAFMGAFLVAILLGMVSHVPGGLGVFEGMMVLLLRPYIDSAQLLPALVVFRAVYYLLPLTIALVIVTADELHQRRAPAARLYTRLGLIAEQVTPRLLAAFTFAAGALLLFSGATPAEHGRLTALGRVLPLGMIEASHFLSSVAGAGLLVLSQGLARRLDFAYLFASALIMFGIGGSLLKGVDYEEAALLLGVLALLRRARPAFNRRAAFFDTRFSPLWTACVVGALAASVWLGLFAYQHVNYSQQLWWQFELRGDASRYLRASVGAAVTLLLVAFARLTSYAPQPAARPTAADLDDAARIIAAQPATLPNLVFLKDKALIFDQERKGFVMYGVQGRTWVALGDPVGPPERVGDLIRLFLERCDDFGGVPVFYEIAGTHLGRYVDFGLTFVKLGEDAMVDLNAFTLEGPDAAKLRQPLHRLERERAVFRIVDPPHGPELMRQLREVSDEWLAHKSTAEKGFSLGHFDEEYLQRFPVGLVEREQNVLAFANIWAGPGKVELSIDLMRHRRDAPNGVMEGLFVHLMLWGKAQGYQRFALGMAPLSGFESSRVASFWNRVGGFLYDHGESFYNFRGLRAYKEKFHPAWEPRYLAYPGGPRLGRALADISALIAGGYRHIVLK
jgi:phosphatidylglycerol lysyltransferase